MALGSGGRADAGLGGPGLAWLTDWRVSLFTPTFLPLDKESTQLNVLKPALSKSFVCPYTQGGGGG